MSTTVDKRVVEMRFDNQEFESRTKTTLGTLEKLKNALNFSNANDGLDKLNRSVGNLNMSPLRSAVEGVQSSFSRMEAVALTALINITNRAVDAGISLAKNLTIDQLSAGWQKYADKTTAVQTIMSATASQFTDTGEQMEYVNAQLERLNWFTDETSYNFVDMVGNIGKFTSNGVALDDAATAMQGVATWAAVSGQNASTASRAMYQLAQSMGTGALKLQDWMSIETANMATYEFKEMALEAAVSLGTLTKTADGCYKTIEKGTEVTVEGFRSSLAEGWLTSDVLVNVLNQYGGFTNKLYEISEITGESATDLLTWIDRYREAGVDTSKIIQAMADSTGLSVQEIQGYMEELTDDMYELGEKAFRAAQEAKTFQDAIDATKDAVSTGWMKTFEIIFGDYEEARVRWTALANELWDIFASGAEARNELLEEALGLPDSLVQKQTASWSTIETAIEAAGIPLDEFIQKCVELGGRNSRGITSIEEFKASLRSGWLTGDIVTEAIDSFVAPINEMGDTVNIVGRSFEDFKRIVHETIDDGIWGNGQARFDAYTEAGWNADGMQAAVNKSMSGLELTIEDYQAALGSLTDEQLRSAGYTDEQIAQLRALQDQYKDFDGSVRNTLTSTASLRTGSELLFDGISKGWNGIKGIFSAMKQGWEIAFPPMTADRLYDILEAFNTVANRFNDWVGNWDASEGTPLSETVEHIRDTFAGLGSVVGIGLDVLKQTGRFLKDTFGESVVNIVNKILSLTASIGQNIVAFRQWLSENNAIYNLFQKIRSLIEPIVTLFQNLGTSIKTAIAYISDSFDKDFKTDALEKVGSVVERISGIFSSFWNVLVSVKDAIISAFSEISAGVKDSPLFSSLLDLWYSLRDLGKSVTSSIGDGGLAGAIRLLGTLSLFDLISSFKELWSTVTEPLSTVKDMFSGIKDSFKHISDLLGSVKDSLVLWQQSLKADVLLKIASAIGILAASLFVLSSIDEGRLGTALAAITVLFAELMESLSRFTKIGSDLKRVSKMIAVMIGLSVAILILSSSLKKISSLSFGEIVKGLIAIGALMLILVQSIKALTSQEKIFIKGAGTLIALAVAVRLIVPPFQALADMSWEQIIKGVAGLGAVLLELVVATRAMKGFAGGSAALAVAAMSILMLAPALLLLGRLNIDQVVNVIFALGGVLAELAIALNLMKGTISGSGALIIAAAAIMMLAPALVSLGGMDVASIAKALGVLAGSFAILGAAAYLLTPVLGPLKVLAAVLGGLGAVIAAIMAADAFGRLASAMAGITGPIRALGSSLGDALDIENFKSILLLLPDIIKGVILSIAEAIVGIADMIGDSASSIARAVKEVLLALIEVIVECGPELVQGALSLLSNVITEMATYIPQIVSTLIDFLITLMNGVAERMPELIVSAMNLIGSFFTGVVQALSSIDVDSLIKAIAGVGLLAGIVAVISLITPMIPTAMLGIVGLGLILVELTAILAVLGAITTDGMLANIDRAIDLAYKIGQFFGALIGGIAAGVMKSVEDIGTSLSNFSTNAQPFFDSMTALGSNTAVIDGIKSLGTALLELTASDLINSLSSFFGGGIDKFGESLVTFGQAMVDFSDVVSGNIDADAVTAAGTAGTALADLESSIPKSGGWVQDILGESDISKFGLEICAFGAALVAYNAIVTASTIDQAAIEASADAATALVGLQDSIPKSGGWWQDIAGEKDIGDFGAKIVAFGGSMVAYSAAVSGFTYDSGSPTKMVINCAKGISGLADIVKENDAGETIHDFGDDLEDFGYNVKVFYNYVSEVDTDLLSSIVDSLNEIVDITTTMSTINTSGIGSFSSALSSLATTGITEFCDKFKNSRSDAIEAVNLFLNSALSAMESLDDKMKTKGESAVDSYLTGFQSRKETAGTYGKEIANNIISSLENLESEFSSEGETSVKNYINKFQNQYRTAKTTGTVLASNVLTGLSSNAKDFATKGSSAASAYVSAIRTYASQAYNAAYSLLSNASSALSGSYSTAKSWGWNFSYGFIQGMSGWNNSAYSTAYSIGQSAVNGLKKSIKAHSPSKEAQESGDYFGIGFVSKILEWIPKAGDAANDLGEETVAQLNKAIANVPALLANGMDFDPVIRPIVDLSNAQQSVATLNSMFNKSIGVAADVASVTGASVITSTKARISADQPITTDGTSTEEQPNTFYNTFNITGVDDPEEVANIVSRRIQKQVDRRKASWAQSSGTGLPLVRSH